VVISSGRELTRAMKDGVIMSPERLSPSPVADCGGAAAYPPRSSSISHLTDAKSQTLDEKMLEGKFLLGDGSIGYGAHTEGVV